MTKTDDLQKKLTDTMTAEQMLLFNAFLVSYHKDVMKILRR